MQAIALAFVVSDFALISFNEVLNPQIIGIQQAGNITVSVIAIYLIYKADYHTLVSYLLVCFVFLLGLLLPALYLGALATTGVSQEGLDLLQMASKQCYYAFGRFALGLGAMYQLTFGPLALSKE